MSQKTHKNQENGVCNEIRIGIIANFTVRPYFDKCLVNVFASNNFKTDIKVIHDLELIHNKVQDYFDIVVVWLNVDNLIPDKDNMLFKNKDVEGLKELILERCRVIEKRLSEIMPATVYFMGFEDFSVNPIMVNPICIKKYNLVTELNRELINQNLFNGNIVDLEKIIAGIGIENAISVKNRYRWGCPYTLELFEKVASKLYVLYKPNNVKCVVLDCDNVLWKGILEEVGVEGVQLGQNGEGRIYHDFQKAILGLYLRGIILTVVSKNDEEDVHKMFEQHSGMVLKKEHIACFEVNWNNKPDNIIKISKILNIGLDSMVFIDDSESEIAMVNKLLPEVKTILFRTDTIIDEMKVFQINQIPDLDVIKKRNETYHTNVKREKLRENCISEAEYYEKLGTKLEIKEMENHEIERVSDLSFRVNRCTNGNRYSVNEIKKMLSDRNYQCYSVYVKDKFSDLGLVGAIISYESVIDLFYLSCRALGRKIEERMLDFILEKSNVKHCMFKTTNKNDALYEMMKLKNLILN